MVRPDFREIKIERTDLYHYGMPERSGRYAWGTGDRPYQRLEKKVSRMEGRLEKRFAKTNKRTSVLQKRSSLQFNRANAQRNSMFKSQRKKAERYFDRGYDLQEKKERLEYRMSSMYQRYLKKFDKLNVKMDDTLKQQGLDYYNRVLANTDSQYKAALMKRVG